MADRAFSSNGLKASSTASQPKDRAPNTTAADLSDSDFSTESDCFFPIFSLLFIPWSYPFYL
ncbi:hypothetical protein LguiA_020382 [Lonicera macranthoides]